MKPCHIIYRYTYLLNRSNFDLGTFKNKFLIYKLSTILNKTEDKKGLNYNILQVNYIFMKFS